MGKKSRRAATAATAVLDPADLADVGPREPCPCGSGKRFKQCHGRDRAQAADLFVARPFEGLPGECDLIAFREVVPAATAVLKGAGEAAGRDVTVCTLLPMAMPGLVRDDGSIWLGLQVHHSTGDPARDLGHVLTAALTTEPGNPVDPGDLFTDGPRLQDLVDTSAALEPVVHEGFDFWVADNVEDPSGEIAAGLERANAAADPTVRLSSRGGAFRPRRRHPADRLVPRPRRPRAGVGAAHRPGGRRAGGPGRGVRDGHRRGSRQRQAAHRRGTRRPRRARQPPAHHPLTGGGRSSTAPGGLPRESAGRVFMSGAP